MFQRRIQNPVEHVRWSFFAKIVNSFQPLTIFVKSSILDVRLGFEYASDILTKLAVLSGQYGSLDEGCK